MRTTLDIDDAILAAAKEIALARKSTAGEVISELARKGLTYAEPTHRTVSGFPVFAPPANAQPLTSAAVKTLLHDDGLPAGR